ncbi:hypothetical protein BPAE_0049g00220 [Botrytis paeoniae]|uniref:Uncharacterized protein n=1 Tax=Botrytis paeoniae TaxID=278948 RepID=A0A4Z1FR69_9HELO|nr:hypothetical protein BPAE_0049g00220 [Botrytis paeoniae]
MFSAKQYHGWSPRWHLHLPRVLTPYEKAIGLPGDTKGYQKDSGRKAFNTFPKFTSLGKSVVPSRGLFGGPTRSRAEFYGLTLTYEVGNKT